MKPSGGKGHGNAAAHRACPQHHDLADRPDRCISRHAFHLEGSPFGKEEMALRLGLHAVLELDEELPFRCQPLGKRQIKRIAQGSNTSRRCLQATGAFEQGGSLALKGLSCLACRNECVLKLAEIGRASCRERVLMPV